MKRRTFEEMITYFNQTVSEMDIDRKYKMTLLGIVTALLQKHGDELAKNSPKVNSDSGELISRQAAYDTLTEYYHHTTKIQHKALHEALERVPDAEPEQTNSWCINSWCIDCKEYDTENKCCHRYNSVIKQTLDDAYRHGETEAEARFHAQQRWIPCSERLPEERQEILATTTDNAWGDVVIIRTYYKEMHKSVIAWMPLPEPYQAERRTDEA